MAAASAPKLDVMMDLSRPRVGNVDRWVRLVVVLAALATLAILVAGPRVAWLRDEDLIGVSKWWFHNALALGFVTVLAIACVPGTKTSRFVRLAVLLPLVQIAVMVGAWIAWQLLRSEMPSAAEATPLFEKLPVHVVLPWIAVTTACGAWLVAPGRGARKRREWLHAAVMLALVNLLLLGLWLPIAAMKWHGYGWDAWDKLGAAFGHPARMIAFVVAPPLVGAIVFTATALRWPHVWRRNHGLVLVSLLLAIVITCGIRADVSEIGAFVYINFMHVLASAAIVAVAAIATLGVSSWITYARGRRLLDRSSTIVGTVSSAPSGLVAFVEQTSWLRGPRAIAFPFTVWTPNGDIPVPDGAQVIAATPLATSILRGGESVPTLGVGDRVTIAGYLMRAGDGPFRDTTVPIAGTEGVTVGRLVDPRYSLTHVGLDLWRPSIAYLLICVAVALPALAALASGRI